MILSLLLPSPPTEVHGQSQLSEVLSLTTSFILIESFISAFNDGASSCFIGKVQDSFSSQDLYLNLLLKCPLMQWVKLCKVSSKPARLLVYWPLGPIPTAAVYCLHRTLPCSYCCSYLGLLVSQDACSLLVRQKCWGPHPKWQDLKNVLSNVSAAQSVIIRHSLQILLFQSTCARC